MTRLFMYLTRARYAIGSLVLSVMTVGMVTFAAAADALPSQDQALTQALENHPEIVAAKAKVALAEAELYGKRMEVSRQVLTLFGNLKTLEAEFGEARAATEAAKVELDRSKRGEGSDSAASVKLLAAAQTAERKLVVAMGQREQAERELRLLLGATPRTTETKVATGQPIPPRQAPQGPIVDTWKAKAEKALLLSYTDQPLAEVLSVLSDDTGIKFSLQGPALEEEGLNTDMPISLSTSQVTLAAALQSFEDAYPQLQFVLRDYGILVTTKAYARSHGYMPVLEMSKTPADGKAH